MYSKLSTLDSEIRLDFYEINSLTLTWPERGRFILNFYAITSLVCRTQWRQWHAKGMETVNSTSSSASRSEFSIYSIHVSHMLRRLMFHITLCCVVDSRTIATQKPAKLPQQIYSKASTELLWIWVECIMTCQGLSPISSSEDVVESEKSTHPFENTVCAAIFNINSTLHRSRAHDDDCWSFKH